MRKKISLCLIVKNEEEVLERCIKSLEGAYDELIIVDTGSEDKTVEIAKSLGAKVYYFEWIDDFGAARNHAFEQATGDWLMWVDADDILGIEQVEKFREAVHAYDEDDNVIGINFPYIYSHEKVADKDIANFQYYRLRIVKRGHGKWHGRIHEFIGHNSYQTATNDEVIFHHFRDGTKGTQNTARNLRILRKVVNDCEEHERPRYLFYFGKELMYNGLFADAIDAFAEYIPISNWIPEKHRALYETAVCYNYLGRQDKAMEYCFKAIQLNDCYPDPYILLGQMAYGNKNWKMVINWMNAATNLNDPQTRFFDYIPNMTYVPYDYMSIAYWNIGNYEKGLECINKCLEYKPTDKRYQGNKEMFEKVLSQ